MNENTECRYGMLTTSQILDVIIGSQGLKKSANGYECKINLYKCNLKVKQVYNLIEFGIKTIFRSNTPHSLRYLRKEDFNACGGNGNGYG